MGHVSRELGAPRPDAAWSAAVVHPPVVPRGTRYARALNLRVPQCHVACTPVPLCLHRACCAALRAQVRAGQAGWQAGAAHGGAWQGQSMLGCRCLPMQPHRTLHQPSCSLLAPLGPMQGLGASEEGNKPFLDTLDLDTMATRRLWQSAPPYFESPGSILSDTDHVRACVRRQLREGAEAEAASCIIGRAQMPLLLLLLACCLHARCSAGCSLACARPPHRRRPSPWTI